MKHLNLHVNLASASHHYDTDVQVVNTSFTQAPQAASQNKTIIIPETNVCPICNKEIQDDATECAACNNWYHPLCLPPTHQLTVIPNSPDKTICPSCNSFGVDPLQNDTPTGSTHGIESLETNTSIDPERECSNTTNTITSSDSSTQTNRCTGCDSQKKEKDKLKSELDTQKSLNTTILTESENLLREIHQMKKYIKSSQDLRSKNHRLLQQKQDHISRLETSLQVKDEELYKMRVQLDFVYAISLQNGMDHGNLDPQLQSCQQYHTQQDPQPPNMNRHQGMTQTNICIQAAFSQAEIPVSNKFSSLIDEYTQEDQDPQYTLTKSQPSLDVEDTTTIGVPKEPLRQGNTYQHTGAMPKRRAPISNNNMPSLGTGLLYRPTSLDKEMISTVENIPIQEKMKEDPNSKLTQILTQRKPHKLKQGMVIHGTTLHPQVLQKKFKRNQNGYHTPAK